MLPVEIMPVSETTGFIGRLEQLLTMLYFSFFLIDSSAGMRRDL